MTVRSGLSRQNPQASGKCFVGCNSGVLRHLSLCRGYKELPRDDPLGLLGFISDIDRRD